MLVKARTRYDFRPYRKNMLLRRIQRRMGLWQVERMGDYLEMLRENPDEIIALYKDLLIGVTGFFRDPEAFQVLEQRVIPELVAAEGAEAPLRVWVPGCSTRRRSLFDRHALDRTDRRGQDRRRTSRSSPATSTKTALAIARRGIYPESAVGDISAERLRRFFTKADDQNYQVNKRLRDAIVFAPQNLIGDAPFSKLDLISCRNLLIYLEPEIQKKVISLFHFALNEGGCSDAGAVRDGRPPSESVRGRSRRAGASTKRSGPTRRHSVEIPIDAGRVVAASGRRQIDTATVTPPGLAEMMQKQLLAEYAPASVLINRKFEVLCFQGPTVDYLEFPSGEPTRDLLALARPGLRTRLPRPGRRR